MSARSAPVRRVTSTVRELQTPVGLARAVVRRPVRPVGTLVLGHGAGGGIGAPDLVAACAAAVAAGWAAVLVEQPWAVAGGRVAPAPPRLDQAWVPVVRSLRGGRGALPGPLVLGGRSAGARVACRTAAELGADALVCLAFPLHPPGRPESSRAHELVTGARGRPVLVVQGERDPFGRPGEVRAVAPPGVRVRAVPGDHALARGVDAVGAHVADFLSELGAAPAAPE